MPVTLTPPPEKVPFVGSDGILSPVWSKWFRDMFTRIGDKVALTNQELEVVQTEDVSALTLVVDDAVDDINLLQSTSATHTEDIDNLEDDINDILQGRQV